MLFSGHMPGLLYALTGAVTGLTAGLFGIGGGMLLVPALLYIFTKMQVVSNDWIMQVAAGTSLATMLFTATASLWAHARQGNIMWQLFQRLWPGIIIGTIFGSMLAQHLSTDILKKILGLMLVCALLNMIRQLKKTQQAHELNHFVEYGFGFLIGLMSGLVGIGGGVLVVPYLAYRGIDTRKISAISSACTIAVAMIGTLSFILTGLNIKELPADCIGYIFWPAVLWMTIPSMLMAPMGARLTYILPVERLKYAFAVIVTLIIIKLFI